MIEATIQAAPIVTAVPFTPSNAVPTSVAQPEKTANDIIKHIGSLKPEERKDVTDPIIPPINLDEIKDPVARAFVEKRIKELESGVNKKFMDAANQRKEADRIKTEYEAKMNEPMTPQKLKEWLNRPDFVQSAQTLQQMAPPSNFDGNQEQWSNLSDGEKQRMANTENLSRQTQAQLNQILQFQIDQRITNRFPDYDSKAVDSFFKDAYEGRIPDEQLREMIHKAQNFDRYVTNAYKYRQEDDTKLNRERTDGMTTTGLETQTAEDKPKMKPGERSGDFFKRISTWNLNRLSNVKK